MLRLFRRPKRQSSTDSLLGGREIDPFQRQLDRFQASPQQERGAVAVQEVSVKRLENEAEDCIKDFQSYVKQIKETSQRLEELAKLLKSAEIPENAYKLILDELGGQLYLSVDDIFKMREILELAKARAKLEWAKEKINAPTSLMPSPESEDRLASQYAKAYRSTIDRTMWPTTGPRVYPLSLQKWEDLISKIDSALSSLSIEEETAIIEQYLSLIKEKVPIRAGSEEIERAVSRCQQRLGSISERWTTVRRSQIEKIINLELEASRINDEIKELEVRFAVGEITQEVFEYKMSALQGNLKRMEKDISDARSFIDNMDMKIFRSSDLLRESR